MPSILGDFRPTARQGTRVGRWLRFPGETALLESAPAAAGSPLCPNALRRQTVEGQPLRPLCVDAVAVQHRRTFDDEVTAGRHSRPHQ